MLLYSKFRTLVLALAGLTNATRSSGCDRAYNLPALAGGPLKGIKVGERNVWLTVPKEYNHEVAAPLVVAFHDKGQTPQQFEEITRLSDPALNPNTIVLYPQAVDSKWLSDDRPNSKVDDKTFVSDLLSGIGERLCIDNERIYATGLGTGGGMVHLLACDAKFAKKLAAFVLVNPLLQSGVVDVKAVKDQVSMLWGHCKPDRVPVRLMEIHGANNTLYNYWGKNPREDQKPILPAVHWLVEWAIRNECGSAYGMPHKDDPDDTFYQTTLRAGHIYEGVVYPDKLQKAIYKCWDVQQAEISTDITEEKAKQMRSLEKLDKAKGSVVLEHFFIWHYQHGWPRITWDGNKTVDMVASLIEPSAEYPAFDATKEALRWFSMFKLSDDARPPNPNKAQLEDPLAGANLDEILAEIGTQVEGNQLNSKDLHAVTMTEPLSQDMDEETTIVVDGKDKDEL